MKKTEDRLTYVPHSALVSQVQVFPVRPKDSLLAFASIRFRDEIDLADIALHAGDKPGKFDLAFPVKTLYGGVRVGLIRPVTKDIEDAIRDAIVDRYLALVRKHPIYNEGV